MKAKKTLSVTLAAAMAAGLLVGCGGSASTATSTAEAASTADSASTAASTEAEAPAAAGKVYYLNFKPEQDEAWQALAKTYTEETGVPVTVVTAASGQYETTLMSEMAKSDAPTLFQVNGPVQRFLRPERWRRHRGHRLRYRELRPDHQQDPAGKGRLHHR